MQETSTPLTAFHAAIRAILDDEDQEGHTAYKITEKIKVVLNKGQVPGYRITVDGSGVEPALAPEADQTSYTLLVNKAALMFPKSLTEHQIFELNAENYYLENCQTSSG
jgi:hypothetical protein